jgi:hypothetical protein
LIYETPSQYFFRLHHVRPRFKNDVESVLLYVAQRVANLGAMQDKTFQTALFDLLRAYPGNREKAAKTIHNWRTEIVALFGLVQRSGLDAQPGLYAQRLAETEDLVEFFRYFLLSFQYPGGHIKPEKVAQQLEAGIQFHPAKFVIELLNEGQKITESQRAFTITSAELTALVFNDLRVTAFKTLGPKEVAELIVKNRLAGYEYDQTGDVVRYAQDILDYLVLADLLYRRPATGTYQLKTSEATAAQMLAKRAERFTGYDGMLGLKSISPRSVAAIENEWLDFVNSDRLESAFAGDILSILGAGEPSLDERTADLIQGIETALTGTTRDIGMAGEALTISHEKNRLKLVGHETLAGKVVKIPDHLGVGYDIRSFEGDASGLNRLIEVKTTRSKGKLSTYSFTLTPNEWTAAKSFGKTYYVYRLIISEGSARLFVIRDPYEQERLGTIEMTPRSGAEIRYKEEAGTWAELLINV